MSSFNATSTADDVIRGISLAGKLAVVTGALIIGRVPLSVWWKFALPLVLILGVMTMILLSVATIILTSGA